MIHGHSPTDLAPAAAPDEDEEMVVEHLVKRKKSKKDKKRNRDKDRHRRSPNPDDAPASPMPDELDEPTFNEDDRPVHHHQKRKAKYADEDEPRSRRHRSEEEVPGHNGQSTDDRRHSGREMAVQDEDEDGADGQHDVRRNREEAGSPKAGGDDQAMSESELESRRAALLAQLNDSMMDE